LYENTLVEQLEVEFTCERYDSDTSKLAKLFKRDTCWHVHRLGAAGIDRRV
jgi:hypothetical protein